MILPKKNILFILILLCWTAFSSFATTNLDSLNTILIQSNNPKELIDAHNKIGWELRFSNNSESKSHLEESFKLLAKTKYPKGRAQALNNWGCNIMLVGQFQEAKDSLNKAVEIYRELNLDEESGKALTNIGSIHYYQGEVEEAIKYCEKAMTYFKGFPEKAAKTNVNIGVMYRTIGKYDLAIEKQLLALEYFKEVNDTSNQLTSLNNIGALYLYFKQYDKSLEYYQKVIDLSDNFPDSKARGYGGLGSTYSKLNMLDKAFKNYQLALKIFTELDLKKEIASTKYNIGDILFGQKKFPEALEHILNAKQQFSSLKLERERITAINMMGLIYFELEKNDSAIVYLTEALNQQKGINDPVIYQSTLRNLAKLYELKGEAEKANELYNVYNESKDSIFNIIAAEKVAESEAKFRLKEKEKQLLDSQAKNKTLTEKLQDYLIWVIALLILVLIVIIIYFKKRKEANFIKTQKEEILTKYASLEEAYANMYNALEQLQKNVPETQAEKSLPDWVSQLSKRELEVLSCLAVGMTDQEISEKLFVSLATVRTHCRRIYSKLLVKNRSEAASFAREYGLI